MMLVKVSYEGEASNISDLKMERKIMQIVCIAVADIREGYEILDVKA